MHKWNSLTISRPVDEFVGCIGGPCMKISWDCDCEELRFRNFIFVLIGHENGCFLNYLQPILPQFTSPIPCQKFRTNYNRFVFFSKIKFSYPLLTFYTPPRPSHSKEDDAGVWRWQHFHHELPGRRPHRHRQVCPEDWPDGVTRLLVLETMGK